MYHIDLRGMTLTRFKSFDPLHCLLDDPSAEHLGYSHFSDQSQLRMTDQSA